MSLARLLQDQRRRLTRIIELLEREREQLVQAELNGQVLGELAERKQHYLSELESCEALRLGVQRRLGYAEDAQGARQAAADAGCQDAWEATLELTRKAQRLNERNGALVGLRMEQNTRLLGFIHQAAEKTLYGASGRVAAQPGRLNAQV
ncbi:flagella synthesis protein FlgN [Halomonas sp. E14]|uniref:flagella synthesis protein FlgN n=1 Tax=Halomonas sp. E14 TaxID=3397245 RepID=UPI00403E44FE